MEFVFEGVKPECLNGRFFNADLDRDAGILMIKEFFQKHIASDSATSILDRNNIKVTFIKMEEDYCQTRIVGKPVCIGCRDCLLLFQYITVDCRFIRFFLVDVLTGNVIYFEDTQRFFNRDMASVSPLESIVCPDKRTILIRLPQTVLTCRKWSKLMQVEYSQAPSRVQNVPNEVNKDGSFSVSGTASSCLRDRKFQAIAAHPIKPCLVFTAVVDEFCSKCKFTVRDVCSKSLILEKTHRLGERSRTYLESDSNSDSDEEETYFLLHQCTMASSRQGDIIALCCFVADNKQSTFIKLFLYETGTMHSVTSHVIRSEFVSLPLMKTEFFSPVMSICDESCSVCHFKRGSVAMKSLCTIRLPRPPNLMRLCRAIILRNTPNLGLASLPLPNKLLKFLRFNSGHIPVKSG